MLFWPSHVNHYAGSELSSFVAGAKGYAEERGWKLGGQAENDEDWVQNFKKLLETNLKNVGREKIVVLPEIDQS